MQFHDIASAPNDDGEQAAAARGGCCVGHVRRVRRLRVFLTMKNRVRALYFLLLHRISKASQIAFLLLLLLLLFCAAIVYLGT